MLNNGRLGNKTIELEVNTSSSQELITAIEQAQKFVAGN